MAALAFAGAVVGAFGAEANESVPSDRGPARVRLTEEGFVFTTRAGMTLYVWRRDDATPGKSQCTGRHFTTERLASGETIPLPRAHERKACVDKWPPFLAKPGEQPTGLWSLIARDEGARQWAYKGRPLYTSVKDVRPGDVNGYREAGSWEPAFAPTGLPGGVQVIRRAEGLVFTTADGRPLYVRTHPRARCPGCRAEMLPFQAAAMTEGAGEWTVEESVDGRQHAYRGQLLYVQAPEQRGGPVGPDWKLAIFRPAPATPSAVRLRHTMIGDVFTDLRSKTLYYFLCSSGPDELSCDDPGDAATYMSAICGLPRECAETWRPLLAAKGSRPVGEWTVVDVATPPYLETDGATYPQRAPRVKAWAFRGRPVYTFAQDLEPGDLFGQNMRVAPSSTFLAAQPIGAGG